MGNNILLKIPMSEKDILAACQENFRKLQNVSQAVVKVEGDTYAATRDPGKVKVSSTDGAADYLQTKLAAGTLNTLTKSTTGATETLTIDVALDHADVGDMPDTGGTNDDHDERYRVVNQAAQPSTNADFWWDSDAQEDTSIYDNIITFGGEVVVSGGNIIYKR